MGSSKDTLESSRLMSDYTSAERGLLENSRSKPSLAWRLLPGIACLLVISNAILLYTDPRITWKRTVANLGPDLNYYGSPATVLTPFSHDWVGLVDTETDDYMYRDEKWEGLFPHWAGSVALPPEFRKQYGLPEDAAPSPEEPDKKIYLIAGYHQLHCLLVVRNALYYLNGTMSEWPDAGGFLWDHVLHCVEAVRLGLTCALDPTLINLNETWPGIPNGQMHQCRNRDAIHAFAEKYGHDIPKDPRTLGR